MMTRRMMQSDLEEDEAYPTKVHRVKSPHGTLFLIVVEDKNNNPIKLIVQVGKTGTGVRAWADSVGRLATRLLQLGATIPEIVMELSNIVSDGLVFEDNDQLPIRSGPDALNQALMNYQHEHYAEVSKKNRPKRTARFNYE